MGTFTKTFTPTADCIVTESYLYSPVELNTSKDVKRVKISRTLWDTGASCSLISERIAKLLNLEPIGKTGVTGYNSNIDVKDTYLIHAGLPTGDIVTNIMAMACESDYNEPKWTNHLFFQNSFKSNNRIQVKYRNV